MFFKEPTQIIEFVKNKTPKTSFDYDEIAFHTHNKVFTIAKLMDLALLKDVQNSLIKAYKNGDTFDTWKKEITPKLQAKGWFGDRVKVKNPRTNEVKEIKVGTSRLKKIFDTNLRMAIATSRYESALQSNKEYFRYTAILDSKTRASHRNLHGLILDKYDDFWRINYPPNGYHCRCKVQALSKEELKLYDYKVSKKPLVNISDKDFAYDIKLNNEKLEKLYEQRLKESIHHFTKFSIGASVLKEKQEYIQKSEFLENALKDFTHQKELYVWQKSLDDMVNEVIIKENQKYPINFIQVGKMNKSTKEFLEKLNKKDLEDLYFTLSKNNLLHAAPKRKASYNQALSIDEIKRIVKVLDEAKEVYWDSVNNSLLYFFDDLKDNQKVNKIIIRPDFKLKKFGKTNAVITLGKVKEDNKKQQELIKIR
ncbi:TPA: minor capsid protein [Campylobacter jejuni]|nr:minor capsid protein [Campylobacter jejuni]HDV7513982.1 minor capsid protein [Campylobacter jejuni]HDV7520734.1 minor capsid protein [Campylobacter jejuni]HED5389976.1 minor capsid protein [Campylobacter jejuni]HED5393465.1 minor capsid protein [Campylobacter jejuni]